MMIRCSTLPRILKCPASSVPCNTIPESDSTMSRLGSAVHKALAEAVFGEKADLDAIAYSFNVEPSDVKPLFFNGMKAWRRIEKSLDSHMSEAFSEKIKDSICLTGTADIIGLSKGGKLVVLDWKSGYNEDDFSDQLMGYLTIFQDFDPEEIPENYQTITVFLRSGTMVIRNYTKQDLTDWWARLVKSVNGVLSYSPGSACTYCPRQLDCRARDSYLNNLTNIFLPTLKGNAELSVKDMADAYPKVKSIEKAIKEFQDAFKKQVEIEKEILDSDGNLYTVTEVTRESIIFDVAYPLLKEEYESELQDSLEINKKKLVDNVKSKVPSKERKEAIQKLMEVLKNAGAINETKFNKIKKTKGEQL